MTRHTLLAVSLLSALASGAAMAAIQSDAATGAVPAQKTHMGFAQLDKNGDGKIDRGEAAAAPRLAERFDRLDADKDGSVTAAEMKAAHGDRREGRRGGWMKADTDKDGRISQAEAAADPKLSGRFAQMDSNHDGYLDRTDFAARMQQRRDECFGKADTDKDGKLSRAEFMATHDACRPQRGKDDAAGPKPPR